MKLSNEEHKMRYFLKTIIDKGEATCEKFTEILRRNLGRYNQLKQFFSCSSNDSAALTMLADANSVVTHRKLSNIKGKSLILNVKTVSNPSGNSSGNTLSGADYTATGASVIFADILDGVNVDTIDCSVNIKQPQDPSAPGGAADLSSQDPSGQKIIKHKLDQLIECLMADPKHILQHVHQESIIVDREYQNLKSCSQPEEAVTALIDQVISKGPEKCVRFLKLLKEPKILEEFPKLGDIFKGDP